MNISGMNTIGIADTTFAGYDMGGLAERAIKDSEQPVRIIRYTVPGIKDLPVASKKLIEEHGCGVILALGMPGPEKIDRQCAHEASQGIQQVQLMTNRHVIEVFVHMDEGKDAKELVRITEDRTRKHALNAIALLKGKDALRRYAGTGRRQGKEDAGSLLL